MRRQVGRRRLRVTADRGFADVSLCDLLEMFDTIYIIRVKSSTKVYLGVAWRQLQSLRFVSNVRQRNVDVLASRPLSGRAAPYNSGFFIKQKSN